ncbi:MAG: sugar phosphate nucleotidyltransferase [Promethearchaeota archaeon]
MKAVILNAGVGKRLGYLTENNPKCLIKITNDETILDLQLKNLILCNLIDLVMLTGPFEEKIKSHISENYPTLNVQYIHNPIYEKTNYIYSIHLLKDFINDDVILLHGDLIFSILSLEQILNSEEKNCVLVNKEIEIPKKDFKALIIDERITKIGVEIFDPKSAFLAPLYKLSKQFFKTWLNQIEKFIKQNKVYCYAEDALNEILNELILKPIYITDIHCMEIDDFEDLEVIRKYFSVI